MQRDAGERGGGVVVIADAESTVGIQNYRNLGRGWAQLCSLSSLAAERNGIDMDSPFTIPKTFPSLLSILLLLLLFLAAAISAGMEMEERDQIEREQLFPEILRDEAVARLHQLGKTKGQRAMAGEIFCAKATFMMIGEISDAESYLERTFLSPASIRASNVIISWMQDAGLTTWVDQIGNIHGRFESMNPSAEALLIGSHLDTVIDAGIYDGSLGIICAISALKALKIGGKLEKLKRPVELIAFSDEEGVKFQSTFLGSAGVAGILSVSSLQISDKSGLTLHDVLKRNSYEATEESFLQLKYDSKKVRGYVEVTVKGSQGHAGTVPMHMRQDPMPGAAELIVLLEDLCKHPEKYLTYDGQCSGLREGSFSGSLVCTVGEISSWPSASNVIPGQVTFTVDLRAKDDNVREAVVFELSNQIYQTCDRRSVYCIIEHKHQAEAVHCDSELSLQLKASAYSALKKMSSEIQWDVPVLMSGAGHDAMAMSHLTKV
ncbi:alpha-amylase 2 [Asimina triloba]